MTFGGKTYQVTTGKAIIVPAGEITKNATITTDSFEAVEGQTLTLPSGVTATWTYEGFTVTEKTGVPEGAQVTLRGGNYYVKIGENYVAADGGTFTMGNAAAGSEDMYVKVTLADVVNNATVKITTSEGAEIPINATIEDAKEAYAKLTDSEATVTITFALGTGTADNRTGAAIVATFDGATVVSAPVTVVAENGNTIDSNINSGVEATVSNSKGKDVTIAITLADKADGGR